jgi:hypothetical protein
MDFSTEDDTIDMPPVQLHFDVGHAPAHLLVDDGPDQNITLTAALSQAAAIENEAEKGFTTKSRKRGTLTILRRCIGKKTNIVHCKF